MLDNILIIAILFFIILSFSIVKVWKKKHFIKTLYIDGGASITFYVIALVFTIILLTINFIQIKELPNNWLFLLILFLYDLCLLFIFCILATTCIYLKDNMVIKKNIFITKKILLNKETKIIEKATKTIIKSKNKSISISSRHLNGNIRKFIYDIKIIINES